MLETKVDKEIVNRLKVYKKDTYCRHLMFPSYFIGCLQSFILRFSTGHVVILKTPIPLKEKYIKEMKAILEENRFDYLDNLTLEIISSLYFFTNFGNIVIQVDKKEKEKFIATCNNFKGKEWNEVISPFIDSVYELLKKCTIPGGQLLLGARMWL